MIRVAATILMPVAYNDATLISCDVHAAILLRALNTFGGYTILPTAQGAWWGSEAHAAQFDGTQAKVQKEEMIPVLVVGQDKELIRKFAHLVKHLCVQDQVMILWHQGAEFYC